MGTPTLKPVSLQASTSARGVELLRGEGVKRAFARHWHDDLQLCAVEAGSGELQSGSRRYATPRYTLFVIPPGEVHSNRTLDPVGCTFRTLMVPTPALAFFLGEPNAARLCAGGPFLLGDAMARRFLRLHRDLERPDSELAADILIGEALAILCRQVDRHGSPRAPISFGRRIEWVRDYLEAHFSDNTRLDRVADLSGISPYHLSRSFRQRFGLPPHAYQLQVRLNRARRLLASGVRPAVVAAETGFTDQSHLGRIFKRYVGIPPAQYSQQRRLGYILLTT